MSDHEILIHVASDRYPLHYRHWSVNKFCQGWVVMLHGIQSHSGWYEYSCAQFAAAGFDVRCVDRRGSGLNQQQRGHTPHWERLVNDVIHILNNVQTERRCSNSAAPIFLVGISWGGKLAQAIAQRRPDLFDCLVLITPGIFAKVKPNMWQQFRLNLARRLSITQRQVSIPLNNPALFTSLIDQQEFIRNDPTALHSVTTGFIFASQSLDEIAQQPVGLSCPLLLMLADQDQIIDNEKTRTFFKQTNPKQNMTICYKDVQHTLELEACRDQFVNDMTQWMLYQGKRKSRSDHS